MEEFVNRLEAGFKEDLYPDFSSTVSVDEYIDKVSEYLEVGFTVNFLQRFKGKTISEIRHIVLLDRIPGRCEKALLIVLLRFFHEQEEKLAKLDERPHVVLCEGMNKRNTRVPYFY